MSFTLYNAAVYENIDKLRVICGRNLMPSLGWNTIFGSYFMEINENSWNIEFNIALLRKLHLQ